MNHSILSGSGGDRAIACPPSYALPRSERLGNNADGDRGTAIHAFLERLQTMPKAEALTLCPDDVRDTCAAIDPNDVPKGEAEIAYVYDIATDTARCLGHIEHRQYPPLGPTEIPCTLDVVTLTGTPECAPEYHEYKTGYEGVPSAAASMQIALGVLCIARTLGVDTVIGHVWRVGSDGQLHEDVHVFDAFELEDCADRWRAVWAGVEAARNEMAHGASLATNPGEHCKWCDAKASCPSFAGIARELLAPGSDWLAKAKTLIDDDAIAADLWVKVERGYQMLAMVQGLLEARATGRPFTLPDGRVVQVTESKRDSVKSPKTVLEVLTDFYGAEVANAAVQVELHTTKSAIEKAAAAQAPKGKGAAEARKVLTVLRERNAIVTNTWPSVEAVEPKRLGKAS